jgi:predicted nucleic acid-binding protein
VRGLLDTSVFITGEQERPLEVGSLPDEAAVSVVSLAELELGVHLAASAEIRSRRLSTLRAVETTYMALPIDEQVASAFARIVAEARSSGQRPTVQDAWIAATAAAHGVPVYTQDAGFDQIPGIQVVRV